MRILLLAPERRFAASFAAALVARGHDVSLAADAAPRGGASDVRSPDLVVADVRTRPSEVDAVLGASALVLLVRPGDAIDVAWVRRRPADALSVAPDGTPAAPAEEVDARLTAAHDAATGRERAAWAFDAVESSRGPLLLVAATGRVEHANPALLRLLGRSAVEGVPERLQDLVLSGAEDPAGTAFLRAVADREEWSGEVRVRAASGTTVPCQAVVAPVRRPRGLPDGVPDGVVVALADLTNRFAEEASLRDANRLLAERASTDPLCGLYNRSYLQQALDREVARWRRYGQPFAVLMVDLDDFKRINDLHGHDVGDDVLRAVAGALREGLREGDVLARYGGDEFCAILPNAPLDAAWPVAERLRERVASVRAGLAVPTRIAASIGIATTADLGAGADGADLLRLADRAMMAAKRAGGDRCLHRSDALADPAPPLAASPSSVDAAPGGGVPTDTPLPGGEVPRPSTR